MDANACTGISLRAQDGSNVVARTVEWAATPMQCGYVVSPRGHVHQSYTPTGDNGLKYKGVYGYGYSGHRRGICGYQGFSAG